MLHNMHGYLHNGIEKHACKQDKQDCEYRKHGVREPLMKSASADGREF